jgi:hypothetical protein
MVASGCVCCPSPEPGTNWRGTHTQPGVLKRTVRGHDIISRSQRRTATRLCQRHVGDDGTSIRVWCSPFGCTRAQQSSENTSPTANLAGVDTAEKNRRNPLSGAVCLLTRRGLISVRRRPTRPLLLHGRLPGACGRARAVRMHHHDRAAQLVVREGRPFMRAVTCATDDTT